MKKLLSAATAIALTFTLGLSLFGCAGGNTNGGTTETEKYTVTYAANEGTGTAPAVESYAAGATVTAKPATTFTREGYTFTTWNDGTKDIAAGATFEMPAKNITLTAQWAEVEPALTGTWKTEEINQGSGSGTYEFVIAEGEKAGSIEAVVFVDSAYQDEMMHMAMFMTAEEDADAAGTYSFGYPYGPKIVWKEADKTMKFVIPVRGADDKPVDEEYDMNYLAPLAANVEYNGDYWGVMPNEHDAASVLHIADAAATFTTGENKIDLTVKYLDKYAIGSYTYKSEGSDRENTESYVLEKNGENANLYGYGDEAVLFTKGTDVPAGPFHHYSSGSCSYCGALQTGDLTESGFTAAKAEVTSTVKLNTHMYVLPVEVAMGDRMVVMGTVKSEMAHNYHSLLWEFSEGWTGRADNWGWKFTAQAPDVDGQFGEWRTEANPEGTCYSLNLVMRDATGERLTKDVDGEQQDTFDWAIFKEIGKDATWRVEIDWRNNNTSIEVEVTLMANSGTYKGYTASYTASLSYEAELETIHVHFGGEAVTNFTADGYKLDKGYYIW